MLKLNTCLVGDNREVLPTLPDGCVQTCVTSPPYFGLRDYGNAAQIGMESSPDAFVAALVGVFREVRRVLKDDGTLWLNLGDSYARAGGWSNNNGLDGVATRQESSRAMSNIAADGGASQKLAQGLKSKDLVGIPWRVAFALQADGWYLRQDIIWAKPNPMPESVTDRCTKAHEYIFLLSKSARYYYDADAIAEPISETYAHDTRPPGVLRQRFYENSKYVKAGMIALETDRLKLKSKKRAEQRNIATGGVITGGTDNSTLCFPREERNKRSVWTVTTKPFSGAHFATFPPDLIEPCILAGSKPGDTVLDPFGGSGTTGMVAESLGRNWILIELNPAYEKLSRERTAQQGMVFA